MVKPEEKVLVSAKGCLPIWPCSTTHALTNKTIIACVYINHLGSNVLPLQRFFYSLSTLAMWGAVLGVAGVYLTDWQVIMANIPYVKDRFEKKDE